MTSRRIARLQLGMLTALLAIGLALSPGCQSSPAAEEDLPPAQPIEDYEDYQEYDDPHHDPYGEPPQESDPMEPGAGEGPPPTDPVAPQGQEKPIDDEQLHHFADAFIQTQEFGEQVDAQMREAQTAEEAQQIHEQALIDLEEEVESTGMAFEDFLMIAERLEQDPALQQRLQQVLQERGAMLY